VSAISGRNPETRMVDRRCRCGTLATEQSRGCQWHAAVSALYAAELLEVLTTAVGANETVFERLAWICRRRRRRVR